MKDRLKTESFVLWVRVKPRSREDIIVGWDKDGYLEIHLKAITQRGEANRRCRQVLSQALGIPGNRIHLEKGQTSGHKRIRIEGLPLEKGKKQVDEVIKGSKLKKLRNEPNPLKKRRIRSVK